MNYKLKLQKSIGEIASAENLVKIRRNEFSKTMRQKEKDLRKILDNCIKEEYKINYDIGVYDKKKHIVITIRSTNLFAQIFIPLKRKIIELFNLRLNSLDQRFIYNLYRQ